MSGQFPVIFGEPKLSGCIQVAHQFEGYSSPHSRDEGSSHAIDMELG